MCQVLTRRRTVSSVAANASPPGLPIISDGEVDVHVPQEPPPSSSPAGQTVQQAVAKKKEQVTSEIGSDDAHDGKHDRDEDKGAERAASTGRAPRQNAPMSNLLEIIQMLKSDDESSDGEVLV